MGVQGRGAGARHDLGDFHDGPDEPGTGRSIRSRSSRQTTRGARRARGTRRTRGTRHARGGSGAPGAPGAWREFFAPRTPGAQRTPRTPRSPGPATTRARSGSAPSTTRSRRSSDPREAGPPAPRRCPPARSSWSRATSCSPSTPSTAARSSPARRASGRRGRPSRRGSRSRRAGRARPVRPYHPGPPRRLCRCWNAAEERERLVRLLARGRSVRLTGPSGSGRTALLEAVAADCAGTSPPTESYASPATTARPWTLLHDLFAAVYDMPLHRPDRAELLAYVHEIGAVVVLDDLEFGGERARRTARRDARVRLPDLAATPEVPAPSADSRLEEVFLGGLGRGACLELLERAVDRPSPTRRRTGRATSGSSPRACRCASCRPAHCCGSATSCAPDPEPSTSSASCPRRAPPRARPGAVITPAGRPAYDGAEYRCPRSAEGAAPAALLAARLSESARATLRFAVALGGEVPHQAHLPALAGDTHADAALGELMSCALLTPVGYALPARGRRGQPSWRPQGYADDAEAHAHTAAQHYAWWVGTSVGRPRAGRRRGRRDAGGAAPLVPGAPGGRRTGRATRAPPSCWRARAAPAFTAGLHWGAWERALRTGQEAARIAGEVAEEAYFHHELGVLALCVGNLDRARAELEASIGTARRARGQERHGGGPQGPRPGRGPGRAARPAGGRPGARRPRRAAAQPGGGAALPGRRHTRDRGRAARAAVGRRNVRAVRAVRRRHRPGHAQGIRPHLAPGARRTPAGEHRPQAGPRRGQAQPGRGRRGRGARRRARHGRDAGRDLGRRQPGLRRCHVGAVRGHRRRERGPARGTAGRRGLVRRPPRAQRLPERTRRARRVGPERKRLTVRHGVGTRHAAGPAPQRAARGPVDPRQVPEAAHSSHSHEDDEAAHEAAEFPAVHPAADRAPRGHPQPTDPTSPSTPGTSASGTAPGITAGTTESPSDGTTA